MSERVPAAIAGVSSVLMLAYACATAPTTSTNTSPAPVSQTASAQPNKVKVGKVTKAQVKEIAEIKMKDLNARDIDAACRIISGTARSMGLTVEG